MVKRTMNDFFRAELRRLYGEERMFATDLPKLAQSASSSELRTMIRDDLKKTLAHTDRLESVFIGIGEQPVAKDCPRVEGFSAECRKVSTLDGDPHVRDVAIIAMIQHVAHDEIAGYGCLRAWAQVLGLNEEAKLLQISLDEKKEVDKLLTQLASKINKEAVALSS